MNSGNLVRVVGWSLCSAATLVKADVVTDWNVTALSAIRTDKTPPPKAARNLAILHTAIYDAVNGLTRTHKPYYVFDPAPTGASLEAAASAAAHEVLANLFPTQKAAFDATHTSALAAIPVGKSKNDGVAWGRSVSSAILQWRSTDDSTAVVPYTPGSAPGQWRPTPPGLAASLLSQWPYVTPFAMTHGSQFRPPGPPKLNSSTYSSDFKQVLALGSANSTTRTAEQTDIVLFWSDGAGTETPPGHWNRIAQSIAAARGNTLEQNARLFALLNIATADAAIIAWDAKYVYNLWRPVTAIRGADTDDNAETVADPNWISLLTTPPFPEYTSGHSTFSRASATVLADFYGTDNVSFTIGSDGLPNVTRSFTSFSGAAEESGISRIYGGIHFLSANIDGQNSGAALGRWVTQNYLQPITNANLVLKWNTAILNAIRTDKTPPPRASHALAIMHTAVYDAVNGIAQTHQPYHVTDIAAVGASKEAAVSAAAHDALVNLFPAQLAFFDTLYRTFLADIPDGPAKNEGLKWGQTVVAMILQWRANDGSTTVIPYAGDINQPGIWRPTPPAFQASPLLPQWGQVAPFGMISGSQFRPPGPPSLTASAYTAEFNEVKSLGAATGSTRNEDQTEIALFWADGAGTVTPPGHWNLIAQNVALARGNTLEENARLFALLNIAEADAAIIAWDVKYVYNLWRPVTAIREADSDGNPDTLSDPNWSSLIGTPPFPEYTSGHSTFSRAAATVLANFYGTDQIPFTAESDGLPGVLRSFHGFSVAADESGISRIYGGIHFQSANRDGQASGAAMANFVTENYLLPLAQLPRVQFAGFNAGQAQIRLQDLLNQKYILQASADFTSWLPIATNTAGIGGVLVTDSTSTGLPIRFYRAVKS